MKLEIRCRQMELTHAIRVHVESRVHGALGRFEHDVGKVVVTLQPGRSDGPRHECKVHLARRNGPTLVLTERGKSMYGVIGKACNRITKVLCEELGRETTVTHQRTTVRTMAA